MRWIQLPVALLVLSIGETARADVLGRFGFTLGGGSYHAAPESGYSIPTPVLQASDATTNATATDTSSGCWQCSGYGSQSGCDGWWDDYCSTRGTHSRVPKCHQPIRRYRCYEPGCFSGCNDQTAC